MKVIAVIAFLAVGCDSSFEAPALTVTAELEAVPPRLAPFLSEHELTPLYRNTDVDFMLFEYEASDARKFDAHSIHIAAAAVGWQSVDATADELRFLRVTHSHPAVGPCGEGAASDGAEEVRIRYIRNTGRVIVGYLQVDHLHALGCRIGEDRFAERSLWPRYDEAIAQNAA